MSYYFNMLSWIWDCSLFNTLYWYLQYPCWGCFGHTQHRGEEGLDSDGPGDASDIFEAFFGGQAADRGCRMCLTTGPLQLQSWELHLWRKLQLGCSWNVSEAYHKFSRYSSSSPNRARCFTWELHLSDPRCLPDTIRLNMLNLRSKSFINKVRY